VAIPAVLPPAAAVADTPAAALRAAVLPPAVAVVAAVAVDKWTFNPQS
jgi:hypothetical protein